MKRVILVGSPRTQGRSVALADTLFEANIDQFPEDELFLVPISEIEVGPCIGCDGCRQKTEVILKGDDGAEQRELQHRCVFDDDMQTVYDLLNDADELVVVCPVYFSGTPAPFKCLLDRMQPYFWAQVEETADVDAAAHACKAAPKRPLVLHVVGEGGDPHGFDPLVGEVRSACAVAGFKLERVLDWVGKIDADGTITAEADERIFQPAAAPTSSAAASDPSAASGQSEPESSTQRPKLDLSAGRVPGKQKTKSPDKAAKSSGGSAKSTSRNGRSGSKPGKGGKKKGGRRG